MNETTLKLLEEVGMPQHEYSTDPEDVRERLEVLFMASEGKDTPFGAQRWFSGVAGYDERTVRGWVQSPQRNTPQPVVFSLIEHLEARVGQDALQRARVRLREHRGEESNDA